jgi:hypothetical protein
MTEAHPRPFAICPSQFATLLRYECTLIGLRRCAYVLPPLSL